MSSIADYILDAALSKLDTEANRVDITSSEATTYTEATSTYSLGNATGITIGAPTDRSAGGREVTMDAVTSGSVTATGTAAYYAIVDTSNSRLLITGSLTAPQVVTSGNTFSLESLTIGIPDPV